MTYGEDQSQWTEVEVFGHTVPMQQIERTLYRYLHENCEAVLAMEGEDCVGFLLYNLAFHSIVIVRALYIVPERERAGMAKRLMNSVNAEVRKIIFQTYKPSPPKRLLEFTKGRRKQIHEMGNLITWEMDWER